MDKSLWIKRIYASWESLHYVRKRTAARAKGKTLSEHSMGLLTVLLSAIIYGFMPLAAKYFRLASGDSALLALLRFFFSALILGLFVWQSGQGFYLTKAQFFRLLILSFFYAVTPPLLYSSYEYLDTGLATVLHFSYPAFVLLLTLLFFRERISLKAWISLLLAIAGIALIQVAASGGGKPESLAKAAHLSHMSKAVYLGVFLALISGLTYAAYMV